jgi:nicotinamidase-related amidase
MSTALLLIDIQKVYFPGGRKELVCSVEAAGAASRLLTAFRKASLPVFHIQHISAQSAAIFFLPGTVGAGIHPGVVPISGESDLSEKIERVATDNVPCPL